MGRMTDEEKDVRAQAEYQKSGYLVFGAVGPLDIDTPITGPDIKGASTKAIRQTVWGIVAETTREEYIEIGMRVMGIPPPPYVSLLTHFYRVVALD